jgi:hypothetical protein
MVWGDAGRELLWAAKLHRFLQAAYSHREVLRWRDRVVNLFLRRRGNEGRAAIEAAGPEIDAFVAGELLQGSR